MVSRPTVKKYKALAQNHLSSLPDPRLYNKRVEDIDSPACVNNNTESPLIPQLSLSVPSLGLEDHNTDNMVLDQQLNMDSPDGPIETYQLPPQLNTNSSNLSLALKTFVSRFNLPITSIGPLTDIVKSTIELSKVDESLEGPSANSIISKTPKFILKSFELCPTCDSIINQNFCSKCNRTSSSPNFLTVGDLNCQLIKLYSDELFIRTVRTNKQKIRDGHYTSSDVYSGSVYKEIFPNLNDLDITVTLNTDGVDLFETSSQSIWPFFYYKRSPLSGKIFIKIFLVGWSFLWKEKVF